MKNKKAKNQTMASTERFLFVSTVRDDTIVLKNSGLRAVLITSSINFALKGEDEQQGILQAYVAMLNSLYFPVQIIIQSRKLNIDDYIGKLDARAKVIDNELLRLQLLDYKKYVTELLTIGEIMDKKFYVVVPYEPGSNGKKKFMTQLSEVFMPTNIIKLSRKRFMEYKEELERRVSIVESGLAGLGLQTARLDTQGLVELLYNSYNPMTSDWQKVSDINELKFEINE